MLCYVMLFYVMLCIVMSCWRNKCRDIKTNIVYLLPCVLRGFKDVQKLRNNCPKNALKLRKNCTQNKFRGEAFSKSSCCRLQKHLLFFTLLLWKPFTVSCRVALPAAFVALHTATRPHPHTHTHFYNFAKADSTLRSSQVVPHPSTNRALSHLTSEVERDPVHST